MHHTGAVGCHMGGVCHCFEAKCTGREQYTLDGSRMVPFCGTMLYGSSIAPCGSHVQPDESCHTIWKPYDAVCTIWSWVGAMGLGWELGGHVYIWFYSSTLIATLVTTVAKERRCGACRRLVCTVTVTSNFFMDSIHTAISCCLSLLTATTESAGYNTPIGKSVSTRQDLRL
jgi:hypothetical protein